MLSLRVCLSLLTLAALAPAQQVVFELRGNAAEQFGADVAGLGDVDGDGYPDLAVGAPLRGLGAIDIFSGRHARLIRTLTDPTTPQLGQQLFAAGDLDRDGSGDLWAVTSTAVLGFSGRTGALLWRYPAVSFVAPAGDVDGDGHADLVAGMHLSGTNVTAVLSGRTGAVIWVHSALDVYLAALASAGDVDADGRADIIQTLVGQNGSVRTIEVRSGADATLLRAIAGDPPYSTGERVGSVGDYNGDGRDDVFIFQPRIPPPPTNAVGRVTIVSVVDGATLATFEGPHYCDRYGNCTTIRALATVRGAADFDGDGQLDPLLVYADGASGASRAGTANLLPTTVVAAAGDVDRDGRTDMLAGFPALGLAQVVRMPSPGRVFTPPGDVPGVGDTREFTDVGDLDRDGYDDFAFSARGYTMFGYSTSCSINSGRDGSVLTNLTGSAGAPAVIRAAPAGDVNRDGRPDLIVGWNSGATAPDEHRAEVWLGGTSRLFRIDDADLSFGIAVAGGADWNNDTYPDVFVAAASFTDVRSGIDGAQLARLGAGGSSLTLVGDLDGDGLHDLAIGATIWSSATRTAIWTLPGAPLAAGDVDRDGRADLWVAEPAGATLYSGRTRLVLNTLPWSRGTQAAVLAAGTDWNGDGTLDLAVGLPTIPPAGLALVVSGRDGAELFARTGDRTIDALGRTVALLAAPSGGTPGFATTSTVGGPRRAGYGLWMQRPDTVRGGVASSGPGCDGTVGTPRLTWLGRPIPGLASALRTTHLTANGAGAVLLGASEDRWAGQPLPLTLTFLGVQDCALRTAADIVLPVTASAQGVAALALTIPANPGLIGSSIGVQGFHRDALAPGGWTASNGLRLVIGQ